MLAPDDTLWLATSQGLRYSRDGGASFQTGDTNYVFTCLGQRGGTLYGCASNVQGMALGSSPNGVDWTSLLAFRDIAGPLNCPAGSLTHDMCLPLWAMQAMQLGIGADGGTDVGPEPGGTAGRDGGSGLAASGGGCSCSVGGEIALGAGVLFVLALLGALLGRGRRGAGPAA
jgi:MYXO-CTERM domain-containing protein